MLTFDGTQVHEVEPYHGVRASIVWYAVDGSWEMDASIRNELCSLGFRPPWRWEECQRIDWDGGRWKFIMQPKGDIGARMESVWIGGDAEAAREAVCVPTGRTLQTLHGIFFTFGGKVLDRVTLHSTTYQVAEMPVKSSGKPLT